MNQAGNQERRGDHYRMKPEIQFSELTDGTVVAHGHQGRLYRIDLNASSCECLDFKYRRKAAQQDCRHLAAARTRAMEQVRKEAA